MKQFKNFMVYQPVNELALLNIIFLKDEKDNDWYQCQKFFKKDSIKIVYDENGAIRSFSTDVSKLFPLNASVAEVTSIPDEMNESNILNWQFDGETVIKKVLSVDEKIAIARQRRSDLLNKINILIKPLEDAIEMDIATEQEIKKAQELKLQRVLLSRLDINQPDLLDWSKFNLLND